MELIHSEDREQFKMQLNWRSALSQDASEMTLDQAMQPGFVSVKSNKHISVAVLK